MSAFRSGLHAADKCHIKLERENAHIVFNNFFMLHTFVATSALATLAQ